ncbi:DNA/RNA non-specific endonuclease [Mucilaginibacter aquariorum]|uniref:DNA/RNA non-specific endonuclease n=1 Tax=Mucilaginibacter aquariorum TaxID=2967225 RepID=A0ABT1SXR3_9SPHI|nr:DNA/RNA non-specific endonuclease [Mucilaginibacter aquariorum]MCQ6957057.1 DNA/RNA non-specific endonuclease [Mucilaginibacter aquariorum]
MKKVAALILFFLPIFLYGQAPDAAYVKALYKKYPTQKSDFCPSCKLWVNPYFKSIADTLHHMPLLTFYIYTKAHRLEQEGLDLPRTGIYAAWHAADGQPDESKVYREANRLIGKPNSSEMIAKGHCQPWILLAWSADAAILSDTYTFNAAMEFQGQNIGTELATEDLCRKLTGHKAAAVTDSVMIWCGTFGSKQVYSNGRLNITVPSYYYKIIRYYDANVGGIIQICYWMPNNPAEKRSVLKKREIAFGQLVQNLEFDPTLIFSN